MSVDTNNSIYLGFDIGGTKCAVCVAQVTDDKPEILAREEFATAQMSSALSTLEFMTDLAIRLLEELEIDKRLVVSTGVSCGGPLDSRRGVVLSPPNLPGWDDIKVVTILESRLGIPVGLENDANACALAEWLWGAGKRCSNMVFFTFGTGLGAGIIANNQLCRGASDMAGEAGHIRLRDHGPVGYNKAGSFEGFCSGGGIAHAAKMAGLPEGTDAKQVFRMASDGNESAQGIVEQVGRQLGNGLSIIIDLLNPERIVLGGIFIRQEDVLRSFIEEQLKRECLSLNLNACTIIPAELGESIGDYGSLAVAMQRSKT